MSAPRVLSVSSLHHRHHHQLVSQARTLLPSLTTSTRLASTYSSKEPMSIDLVTQRVLLVLKLYDKVNPETLTLETHFYNDVGLDSLDHVEVIMAMEDEFGFEIPDEHGEKLLTPAQIVQYVCDHEDIYE